MADNLIEAPE